MNSTSSEATIKKLFEIFTRFGMPKEMVADNGPQLISAEMVKFCKVRGIKLINSTPYHPRSNGAAERNVRTVKAALKAGAKLQNFLLMYRNTPHSITGRTPAEMMLKFPVRWQFSVLLPSAEDKVESKGLKDFGLKETRELLIGELVWARVWKTESNKFTWKSGIILNKTGPLSYLVEIEGKVERKHVDQLMKRSARLEEPRLIQQNYWSSEMMAGDEIGGRLVENSTSEAEHPDLPTEAQGTPEIPENLTTVAEQNDDYAKEVLESEQPINKDSMVGRPKRTNAGKFVSKRFADQYDEYYGNNSQELATTD